KDETVVIKPEKQALEVVHHLLIIGLETEFADHRVGKRPIVVEAATVLDFLDVLASHAATGEALDGADDGLAIGAGDVDQYPVEIEDQQFAHRSTSRSAARNRRNCAFFPTVTRTQPGTS